MWQKNGKLRFSVDNWDLPGAWNVERGAWSEGHFWRELPVFPRELPTFPRELPVFPRELPAFLAGIVNFLLYGWRVTSGNAFWILDFGFWIGLPERVTCFIKLLYQPRLSGCGDLVTWETTSHRCTTHIPCH